MIQWFKVFTVLLRKDLLRFVTENDRAIKGLVVDITKSNFANLSTSDVNSLIFKVGVI